MKANVANLFEMTINSKLAVVVPLVLGNMGIPAMRFMAMPRRLWVGSNK